MNDFLNFLNQNKKTNDFLTGTVVTTYPLTVKIIPSDSAINAVCTNNLNGLVVGSRVILQKFQNQFIAIAVIGNHSLTKCILSKTATQSIPTATYTKITFGTGEEDYDPLGMHDISTNNTRITVPTEGVYNIVISGRFANSSSGSARLGYIYVNNSQINSVSSIFDSVGRSAFTSSLNLYLSANDYVEFVVYQASGSNLDIGGSASLQTHFSVIKV